AVGSRRVRALARGWVARAGVVALVGGRADDGVAPSAAPALAAVGLRAGVGGVAGGAVGRRRARALARGGVARAGLVALIGGGADDGVGARAHTALAGVGRGAPIPIVAHRAVGCRRGRAQARGRITGPGVVTLVGGRANHGVAARAHFRPAGVGLRTGFAIVARRLIRRGDPYAAPCPAGVARRALVAVVAGRALGCRGPLAHAQGAAPLDTPVVVLAGGAVLHGAARATTLEALLVDRAGVAVVAGGTVGDD